MASLSGASSIANNSAVAVAWSTETYDVYGELVSTVFTAAKTGWYQVNSTMYYEAVNTTGVRSIILKLTSTTQTAGVETTIATNTQGAFNIQMSVSLAEAVYLYTGDVLKVYAFQTSGGSLNILSGRDKTRLSIRKFN